MKKLNGSGGRQGLGTQAKEFLIILAPYAPLKREAENKSVEDSRQQGAQRGSGFCFARYMLVQK